MHAHVAVAILLGLTVLITVLCSIGVMVMRDAFQRLHFSAVVVSFGSALLAAAVWVDEKDPQARIKIILIGLILFVMNAVLTHATGRAVRIHQAGHWEPEPAEQIPIIGRDEIAGASGSGGVTTEHRQA